MTCWIGDCRAWKLDRQQAIVDPGLALGKKLCTYKIRLAISITIGTVEPVYYTAHTCACTLALCDIVISIITELLISLCHHMHEYW